MPTVNIWGFLNAKTKDQSPGCDQDLQAKLQINAWISKIILNTKQLKNGSR